MTLRIEESIPLAPHTTLGVGGSARYYAQAREASDVGEALEWAASRGLAVFVLGGGSNLVLADEGFPGLVLHLAMRGLAIDEQKEAVRLTASAGQPWDELVGLTVDRGWAGLECLSGIPGLVGATPIQNVGAYGQEVADTIEAVDVLDRTSGARASFEAADCGFAYRDSRFKGSDRGRYIVLGVRFRLDPGGRPAIRYPELGRALEARGVHEPTLADARAAVLEVRRRKSMVVDAADPFSRSAGSFFVNPIVDTAVADGVEERLRAWGFLQDNERLPRYPAAPGQAKLAAAWLIERSGLPRGTRRGAVGLSPHHALAIVNHGGATAADVVSFAREVRDHVREHCGIALVPEPVFVGVRFDE
jgi:UDP-N-acetylmuramate dehydrogenase